MARPGNGNTALFYDTDNRRFVGWSTGTTDNSKQILSPLQDPEEALFSFKTGMELIYMESTRFSNGLVYAILQDQNGQRHIYGINMGGNGFVQESKYENLQAPGFDQASRFAFHSQFPFLFYAEPVSACAGNIKNMQEKSAGARTYGLLYVYLQTAKPLAPTKRAANGSSLCNKPETKPF